MDMLFSIFYKIIKEIFSKVLTKTDFYDTLNMYSQDYATT